MTRVFFRAIRTVLFFLPVLCNAKSPKIAQDLANVNANSKVDVIVQFKTPPDNQQRARVNQLGGTVQADLGLINGMLISVPANALEGLANNPNVVYISPDRQVNATLDYANPTVGAQVAFANGWVGTNVGVAIVDSGILQQKDLNMAGSNTSR